MNNLVITVESGSDMPEDLAGQYGIFIVPMYVQFGDKTCADGSFPPSEVCRYFKETGKVPKTSGSSPDDYRKVFDEIHSRWPEKKILHLAYSAVTTCSFQSARIAEAARKVASGEFSVRISPIRGDGKKDEVEVLIEDFNTMAGELESTEILKNDFISNISHEFKTPLSVIQTYAAAMKVPDLTEEERKQYADVVIGTTKKLSMLVTNVLRLSKLQNQGMHPEPERYQLGEQIRQCALGYMEQWEKKKIQVQMDVEDVEIYADRSLLELVWNNLLSNAVKFTGREGRITVRSEIKKTSVRVSVRDTGCGIPEEILPRIFDKFYQGDTSHATEGNGLGLALVKKVLEIVSGKITVESRSGEGSVFTVYLPLRTLGDGGPDKKT